MEFFLFTETGNLDEGVWSAGTVMGLIDNVVTCEELINNIVDEAETIIKNRLNDSVIIDKDGPIVATPRWLLEYNYVEDVCYFFSEIRR